MASRTLSKIEIGPEQIGKDIPILPAIRHAYAEQWPGCWIDNAGFRTVPYPLNLSLPPGSQTFTIQDESGAALGRWIALEMTIRHDGTGMHVTYERDYTEGHRGEKGHFTLEGPPRVNVRGITADDMPIFATSINALVSVLAGPAQDARKRSATQYTEAEKRAILAKWKQYAEEHGGGKKNRAEFAQQYNLSQRSIMRWENELGTD